MQNSVLLPSFLLILAFILKRIIDISIQKHVLYMLNSKRKALLVTAHPDDESMFFAPTILQLKSAGFKIYIICLSNGGYNFSETMRFSELQKAANVLELEIIELPFLERFPDDPTTIWPTSLSNILVQTVKKFSIDCLITFDSYGISGHLNHISIHNAITQYLDNFRTLNCDLFLLESTNIFLKYVPFSYDIYLYFRHLFNVHHLIMATNVNELLVPYKAMLSHESQLTWFRYLYILFSNYMRINSLVPLHLSNR